jgi:hypothetical protein
MLSLALGPGGPFRRAAADAVPLLLGGLAFEMTRPIGGIAVAVAAGLVACVALSAALRIARRRTGLRRAWRLALLAYVVFGSWQGLRQSSLEPAGPSSIASREAWGAAVAFRAGAADAAFDLPATTPLGGWGQRPRRVNLPAFGGLGVPGRASRALMASRDEGGDAFRPLFARPEWAGDAIGARALVLLPAEAATGPPLAFVRLDLVVADPDVCARTLEGVRDLGFTAATLLVSATHTHSGAGGFSRAPLAQVLSTDHFDPRVFDAVVAAAVKAIRWAHDAARPARIAFRRARDRDREERPVLAQNRRLPDADAVDDRVIALRVEDAESGAVLALLLNYAVHPVLVGRGHAAFDRDLAGALERSLAERFPGSPLVLFVNGALGDVTPRDAERDDRGAMEALARRFADAVVPDLAAGETRPSLRVSAARALRDPGSPHAVLAVGDRAVFLDEVAVSPWGRGAAGFVESLLALPANAAAWGLGLGEVRAGFSFGGAAGAVVNLEKAVGRREHAFGAVVLEASGGDAEPERLAILWQGGEPTQAVGRAWRAAAEAKGHATPMLFGLTNDALGYLVTEEEYRRGGYEATATFFGSRSADLVADALLLALSASR